MRRVSLGRPFISKSVSNGSTHTHSGTWRGREGERERGREDADVTWLNSLLEILTTFMRFVTRAGGYGEMQTIEIIGTYAHSQ